jgi:hypothetical protein
MLEFKFSRPFGRMRHGSSSGRSASRMGDSPSLMITLATNERVVS